MGSTEQKHFIKSRCLFSNIIIYIIPPQTYFMSFEVRITFVSFTTISPGNLLQIPFFNIKAAYDHQVKI